MPAQAPPSGPQLKKTLRHIGEQIRARRKGLKVTTIGAAEAAGISRMTLNRIERGETSVTMGAYLNVMSVLGIELTLTDPQQKKSGSSLPKLNLKKKIKLTDYPELKKLAWQLKSTKELTAKEALSLYERNWRHVDIDNMKEKERDLIQSLLHYFGKERLFV